METHYGIPSDRKLPNLSGKPVRRQFGPAHQYHIRDVCVCVCVCQAQDLILRS
jgi:hypothetical protein